VIDDLLTLAEDLAQQDSGRPKQASLRRAVATACYALFHALAKMCADQLVGFSKPWDVYTPIYRSIDHGGARKVLREARKDSAGATAVGAIGVIFSRLYDKRIEADYVPEPFKYSRREVKDLIQEARDAIGSIESLSPETKLRLAVQFVTKSR
jgi:uncharacterized protein (UPF0332 family)